MGNCPAIVSFAGNGRTRLRFPSLRDDERAIIRVGEVLAAVAGVTSITVNPLSAGVLVTHTSARKLLLDRLREHGFHVVDATPSIAGGRIALPVSGRLPWKQGAGLVLLGLAAWQIREGNVLGPASSLLASALSLLSGSRGDDNGSAPGEPD